MASRASKSTESYEFMMQEIERIERQLPAIIQGQEAQSTTVMNPNAESEDISKKNSEIQLEDPNIALTKGRPRMKTMAEKAKKATIYHCSHCGSTQHNFAKCEFKHLQFDLPKRKRVRKNKDDKKGTMSSKTNNNFN